VERKWPLLLLRRSALKNKVATKIDDSSPPLRGAPRNVSFCSVLLLFDFLTKFRRVDAGTANSKLFMSLNLSSDRFYGCAKQRGALLMT